jgi:hypothetical protein
MKMEQIGCSETSAYKIQRPGNHPEENIQHTEHGESLKSKITIVCVERERNLHWVRALTVPMHLGFTDSPFVPHNLISVQESPVPLPKFQMAPRLKILMSSGSKTGTQTYYSFLSKRPGKRIPSRFPNGAPMETETRLQGIFTPLLKYLFNISFGAPSKGALPPGPPHGVPSERDTPFLVSSIHYSKPPVYEPHS